jgi:hypothetical protein
VNNDNFKALLLFCVKLLTACNFLDQLLNNNTVIKFSFAGCYLNVIHTTKNDGLARRRGGRAYFELFLFTLDFVHRLRIVQRLQQTLRQGTFATPGGAVEENMWEVLALCKLFEDWYCVVVYGPRIFEIEWAVLFNPQFLIE